METESGLTYVICVINASFIKQVATVSQAFSGKEGRSNPFPPFFPLTAASREFTFQTIYLISSYKNVYKNAEHFQPAEKVSLQFKHLGIHSIRSSLTKDYNCRVKYNTHFRNPDWASDSGRLVWHEQRTILFKKKPVCYQYIILQSHAATHGKPPISESF